jgi:hypothetical protein
MHKVKKSILCTGLGLGGLFLILGGEINHLQCDRNQDNVTCIVDRQQVFPPYQDRITIRQVARAEIEVSDDSEVFGSRVSLISPQGSVPLTTLFVSESNNQQQIAEINQFIQGKDSQFKFTDFPLWTYLFGGGFIVVGFLCLYTIPVSKFDRF